jgi:hypothetical protein
VLSLSVVSVVDFVSLFPQEVTEEKIAAQSSIREKLRGVMDLILK